MKMKKILSLTISLTTLAQNTVEPDLYLYEEEWVLDSVKVDSIVTARNGERKAELEIKKVELEGKLAAIHLLMEHEQSGKKVKDEAAKNLLAGYANLGYMGLGSLADKRKDMQDGYVPKGLAEKILTTEMENTQKRLADIGSDLRYRTLSWDDVYDNLRMNSALPKYKTTIRKPNPECRDNYFNGNFTRQKENNWGMAITYTPFSEYSHWEKYDDAQQSVGWEWLNEKDRQDRMKFEKVYFPEEYGYYIHSAYPKYRFVYVIDWGGWNAFDKSGTLVRMDNMTKFLRFTTNQEAITDNILMQLCKRDFLANKYNIKSAKPETLTALRITFGIADAVDARFKRYMKMAEDARNEKLSATTAAHYATAQKKQNAALNVLMEYVAKEREPQALKYIKQLKADHATELSYLYKIERINNTTFKLYFINDKMECGCIALMKWHNKAPYEAEYEIELLPFETITIRK